MSHSSMHTRRVACTHVHLTRQYGVYTCDHCHQTPGCGWIYRCTQDCGQRPRLTEDRGDGEEKQALRIKPWMEQAAMAGHYTTEQIIFLKVQRQNVLNNIAAAEKSQAVLNDLDPTPFNATKRSTWQPSLIDPSDLAPPHHDPDIGIGRSTPNFQVQDIGSDPQTGSSTSKAQQPIFPYCNYKTCSTCRPFSRDRAWLSLGHVFNDTPTAVDLFHVNRPISSVDIVRQIGLHKTRPSLKTFDSMINSDCQTIPTKLTPSGSDNLTAFVNASGTKTSRGSEGLGFGQAMKRTFREIIQGQRHLSPTNRSGKLSKTRKNTRIDLNQGRKPIWGDLSTHRDREFSLVMACNALLPGRDGFDDLEEKRSSLDNNAGEVIVKDGIAVTEEAVDLGAADIIMQV